MENWLALASSNLIFSIPLGIVFLVGVIETLLALFGLGLSDSFEFDITPNSDVSTLSELFSFMNKGQIPTLMLLLTALTSFGLIGLISQNILTSFGLSISNFIVAPLAFISSIPINRYLSLFLSRILPRDETTAISTNLLVGKLAQITIGTATTNTPAEAKITDMYGETHYIMIKPAIENISFKQGEKVLLVKRENPEKNIFLAQPDPNTIVKPN